jgi:hypothetical protein
MRRILILKVSTCAILAFTPLARADDAADVKALVQKALKACGGEEKLSKVKAMTMKSKGIYYGMGDGIAYTETTSWQYPDKVRSDIKAEVKGEKFTLTEVFNGDKAWESTNGKTEESTKDAAAEAKESMYGHRVAMLYPLLDKAFTLTPLGEVKVGDKAAVGIKVAHKDHRDINILFDKKTNLIIKIETQVKDLTDKDKPKEVTQETFFDDYKDVDGIPQPHKMVIKRDGKKFVEAEMTEIKIVDKLEDKLFEKP